MTVSVEAAVHSALAAAIAAAEAGDALFEAELHETLYEPITKPFGVRVGDASSDLEPASGGAVEEFDVLGMVQVFARAAKDSEVTAAREKVRALTIAVAQLFFDDTTLGGAVSDSRVLGGQRGWASVKTVRHAVATLHLIANETGAYKQ